MESLLGPTMANVFLFYKLKLLEQYPNEFNPFFFTKDMLMIISFI